MLLVAVVLAAAALAAALAGVLPGGIALAAAGLVPVARAAALLRRGDTAAARTWPLGAGLALCGLSAVAAGLAAALAPQAILTDVPLPAELPLIGLFFVAGTLLAGLFHLPGQPATYAGRARRLLDGIGIGILLFFIAWLVVFESAGLRGAGLTAALVAAVAVGAAAVGTLRAVPLQPAAALRGLGVLVTIAAQTALVLVLDYHRPAPWLLLPGAPLVAGTLLAGWALPGGTVAASPPPGTVTPDGSFARYPLLALPLAGALVAGAYHLLVAGHFDAPSALLAALAVFVVATREAFAVADVRQYARSLAEREARFRALVAGSADVTMMLDDALVVRWQSPAAARRLGLADADVVGRPLLDRVHPDDAGQVSDALTAGAALVEARLGDGFGVWRETEWSVSDQRGDPAVRALVVHVRDIGPRRELEHALRQAARSDHLTGLASRAELRRVLAERTTPCVLIVLGLDGLTRVNQLRGHEVGDAVLVEAARRLRAALTPGDVAARLTGDQFAVLTTGGAVHAQVTAARLLTLLSDPYPILGVAARLSASAGLAEHPVPDATPSAASASAPAGPAVAASAINGPAITAPTVPDPAVSRPTLPDPAASTSAPAGPAIAAPTVPDPAVSRPTPPDPAIATAALPDLEGSPAALPDPAGRSAAVVDPAVPRSAAPASAAPPAAGGAADATLGRAELALQRARQLGPAQPPQWYDEAAAARVRRRLAIEQDLPGAMARGELDLLFQPVVELPSGRCAGVEARPRWRRPGLGAVSDTEFLPVADQLGLQTEIAAWLLAAAGRQVLAWTGATSPCAAGSDATASGAAGFAAGGSGAGGSGATEPGTPAFDPTPCAGRFDSAPGPARFDTAPGAGASGEQLLWLAVPVSSALLAGGGFAGLLAASGFPPSRLVVQFSLADDGPPELAERLAAVRALGARTALDGFGGQAASLSRLRRLPLDLVRVDRGTFAGTDTAVVAAVVNLARQLGVDVAAEGVCDEAELQTVRAAGCRLAQGELFCAASVPERLEAYLVTQRATRN